MIPVQDEIFSISMTLYYSTSPADVPIINSLSIQDLYLITLSLEIILFFLTLMEDILSIFVVEFLGK